METKKIYEKIMKVINGDKHTPQLLEEIKKELEMEILSAGKINNSIKTAFKRLQKENEIRPKFQNVLKNNDNLFSITNSYFLITYNDKQLPNELKPFIDKSNEINEGFTYEKLKNKDELSLLSLNFDFIKKVYKYNKLNKIRNTFTLQNGYTFNIQYLLDIITLLNYKDINNIKIYISEDLKSPMNIETENGNAILLPLRPDTDEVIQKRLSLQENIYKNL